jgi:hypothetical protein
MERDFDTIATTVGDAYAPFYNEMLEQVAVAYAAHFTVEESPASRANRSGCQPQGNPPVRAAG